MPVWRILYTAIKAEKTEKLTSSVEVNTNTKIKDVRREKVGKGEMLAVDFTLETSYTPKVGSINVSGTVYYAAPDLDKIITEKKGKGLSLEASVMREIHLAILREPVIIAINNAKDLGLPMPISFPSVRVQTGKKESAKKKEKKKPKKSKKSK